MKKWTSIILMIMVSIHGFSKKPIKRTADKNLRFTLYAEYLQPADERYSETYGDFILFPGAKIEVKLFRFLGLFASYGYLHNTQIIEEVDQNASSDQHLLSAGLNLSLPLSDYFQCYLSGGAVYFIYSEKALGDSHTQQKFGYRGDLGIVLTITKLFHLEASGGYTYGRDQVREIKIKLGGLSARLGLGISF